MKHLGIQLNVKNSPVLDPEFMPIGLFNKAFLASPRSPLPLPWSVPAVRWL